MAPLSGFTGPFYQGRSIAAESEDAINLYCELIESGHDASQEAGNWCLYGTPGRQLYCTLDDSPVACVVSANQQFSTDSVTPVYFAIAGKTLYSIANHYDGTTFTGVPTTIGTVDKKVINNTGGQLFPAQIIVLNPNLLFVVANGRAWVAAYGTPITASSLNFGGLGYAPGDTGIIVGSNGLDAKYLIQTVDNTPNGTILTSAVNNWGSGYAVGDTGSVAGGTGAALYTVTQVSATGQVQAFTLTGGFGYAAGLNIGTATGGAQPGTGSGFTINILTISNSSGAVLTYTLSQTGSGYSTGTNIATTAQGNQPGAGDGNFTVNITSVGAAAWQLVEQAIPEGTALGDNYITACTFMDNYVIVTLAGNEPDPQRRQFFISGLADPSSWSALDFGEKEGNSDPNVAPYAANEILNIFGLVTMERWLDLPNGPAFPFQRMQGSGLINVGCASPWTICTYQSNLLWIGNDAQGQLVAWMQGGQVPQRISNFAIENRWRNFDVTGSSAFTYEENGHYFYVVHFPIPDETWVCDLSTIGPDGKPIWHRRAFWDGANWHADIGRYHAWSFPIAHVVGDYSNGNLYIQSIDILTDNCNGIRRLRVTPHVNNELKWNRYSRFRLQLQSGIYASGVTYTLSLRTSDDGGFTFGPYLNRNGGQLGNYEGIVPVEWYRLGRSRNRVFEVSTSDPVPICWVDASIELRGGSGV